MVQGPDHRSRAKGDIATLVGNQAFSTTPLSMQKEFMIIYAVVTVVLAVFILSVVLYNRSHQTAIERFRQFAQQRNAKVFRNKDIRFWRTYGMRTLISPWTVADLFWFGDMLVILRVQQFILKIHHPPVVIRSRHGTRVDPSLRLETHRPSRVRFARHYPGVLDIKLTDKVKEYGDMDIKIQGLSREEQAELLVMEGWVSPKGT